MSFYTAIVFWSVTVNVHFHIPIFPLPSENPPQNIYNSMHVSDNCYMLTPYVSETNIC